MQRYVQVSAIGILLALSVGFPAAQNTQGPPAVTSLIQKANRDGSVRVIVGVRAAFTPEGRLDHAQAVFQRDTIALAQADVINRLAGFPIDAVRQFSVLRRARRPGGALAVGGDGRSHERSGGHRRAAVAG